MDKEQQQIADELKNTKEVLSTLIAWLYTELGESNVKTLLEKLNK